MLKTPCFRNGTWDEAIFNSCRTEYGIKSNWLHDVIDVGAHVGGFTDFILSKGANHVFAVEPDVSNYSVLADFIANSRWAKRVTTINKAVGNSPIYKLGNDPGENTGGKVFAPSDKGIGGISFNELFRLTARPILLKLDCEGCEHTLVGVDLPDNLHCVVGEYHGSVTKIKQHFFSQGFLFSSHETTKSLGLFGAHRRIKN